jgi:plasmid maintenance system killer protein
MVLFIKLELNSSEEPHQAVYFNVSGHYYYETSLRILNNSQNLMDLQVPPSNRLEKMKGNLKVYHSIRINDQWRIIFKWDNGSAADVEIIDYH